MAILADGYGGLKKCFVCKNDIISASFYRLENEMIHCGCYKCSKCKVCITPETAQIRGMVVTCTPCYGKAHWKKCCKCNEPMKPAEILTVYDKQMHPKCYCCAQCKQTMMPGRQYEVDEEIFCSIKCAADFRNAAFRQQQLSKKAAAVGLKTASLAPKTAKTPAPPEKTLPPLPPKEPVAPAPEAAPAEPAPEAAPPAEAPKPEEPPAA